MLSHVREGKKPRAASGLVLGLKAAAATRVGSREGARGSSSKWKGFGRGLVVNRSVHSKQARLLPGAVPRSYVDKNGQVMVGVQARSKARCLCFQASTLFLFPLAKHALLAHPTRPTRTPYSWPWHTYSQSMHAGARAPHLHHMHVTLHACVHL